MITMPVTILMIDDDMGDVRITQEALRDSKVSNELFVCPDGEEGMKFLRKEGSYADAPDPDLIFLDINMPKMDGHQTLTAIRKDPKLTHLPVVMLTTSDADKDILRAYQEHANCYVTKPVELDQFLEVVRQLEDFWVSIVRLPPT